jgi:hypothetical protein
MQAKMSGGEWRAARSISKVLSVAYPRISRAGAYSIKEN